MKTTQRHHLKDNELAIALHDAQTWATENSRVLIITVAAIATFWWEIIKLYKRQQETRNAQ